MSLKTPQHRKESGPSALFMIEEAVHLLRRAPSADLCWYYAGGVPWVLGLLFFWSYTTWFTPSGVHIAWGGLFLTLLFVWLKFCQTVFATRLLARRRGVEPPVYGWRSGLACALRQVRVHTWGLFVLPVSALLTAPMGYMWTYYQMLTVADSADQGKKDAWDLAKLWPMQTHIGMMILSLLVLVGWINLAGAFLFVPFLVNRFLGMPNIFGMNEWTILNTSFLATTVACAWLAADPLFKSYHAVRCFHGRALTGGEDLREAFLDTKVRRALLLLALVGGMGAGGLDLKAHAPASEAEPTMITVFRPDQAPAEVLPPAAGQSNSSEAQRLGPSTTPQRVVPTALQQSIEQTLQTGDFSWRLRSKPSLEKDKAQGPVVRFIKLGVETIKEIIDSIERRYQKLKRWWKTLFGGEEAEETESTGNKAGRSEILFNLFTYVLGGLLLLVLGYLCFVVARQARRNARRHILAVPNYTPLAKPDLRDEAVHAAQLPSEGWLALAREKLGAGEWRLAFRALYLAQLASLSEQGFLSLAQHKTNQDYETELRRRQPQRSDLLDTFGRRRRGFDAVWYGRMQAEEAEILNWLAELERRRTP